jgi:hypothetical protein
MKKIIIGLGLAATILPAMASAADVAGEWVRDAAVSDPRPQTMYWLVRVPAGGGGGGGGNQEFVLSVKQDAAKLLIANPNQKPRDIALDGKPYTVATDTGIQRATVTAVNRPDALVISTRQPFGGMPGNAPLTVTETWTVSPDLNTLTVATVRQLPAQTTTDKQVYKRRS